MKGMPFLIVLVTVVLGLVSAWLLKEASMRTEAPMLWFVVIFILAVIVNGMRFALWGMIHRRYPISMSYPLSSIFFPLVFVMGYFVYGESATLNNIIGAVLIVLGVGLMSYEETGDND